MIELNEKALRRRAKELFGAAGGIHDSAARALLLFYSAECGLKAIYMSRYMLKTTASVNGAVQSAASYKHSIDKLIRVLRIPPASLPHSPGKLALRAPPGEEVYVGDLNQVWRYGATLVTPNSAIPWLESVVAYVLKELR